MPMEQPKNILSCWDFLTPVNCILILSFLLFPLPTSAPETGSTEKFVSPQKKRKRRREKKIAQGRDKAQFSWPDVSHKSHYGRCTWRCTWLCMAATRQNPVWTGCSWETINFTTRDGSDFISSSIFYILLCISQHETLLFVPSFNISCRERVIFTWKLLSLPSTNALQRMVMELESSTVWVNFCKIGAHSMKRGVLLQWLCADSMEQTCGWNDLQKSSP